jgi:hypothetical protein
MKDSLLNYYLSCQDYDERYLEWWWSTPEALEMIATALSHENYVIIDHFLLTKESSLFFQEVTLTIL